MIASVYSQGEWGNSRHFRSVVMSLILGATLGFSSAWAADPAKPSTVFKIPEPYIVSPKCADDLKASLSKQQNGLYRILECYKLIKWGLDGIGIAAIPTQFEAVSVDAEAFAKLRKAIYENQTALLHTTRDPSDSLTKEEPAHAAIPHDLFVKRVTAIGVFMNEATYIGIATLIPPNMIAQDAKEGDYPVIRTETLVLVGSQVYSLIQTAQLKGPQTFRFAYTQAEDWARRMNGGRRLATED